MCSRSCDFGLGLLVSLALAVGALLAPPACRCAAQPATPEKKDSAEKKGFHTGAAQVGPVAPAEKAGLTGQPAKVETTGQVPRMPKPKPAAASKQAEPWDPARAEEEYRMLQFELALAKTATLYLVLDVERMELALKVKGTVVWDCPLEIAAGDSGDLERFVRRFKGDNDQLVRLVSSKHLFAGAERTPDSILAIVGRVVKTDPRSLQRDVPERFQVFWGWDLVLDVRTDIVGLPDSKFRNTRLSVLETVRRPFGETSLTIRMPPESALTLYRAANPGLPTVVYAPLRKPKKD